MSNGHTGEYQAHACRAKWCNAPRQIRQSRRPKQPTMYNLQSLQFRSGSESLPLSRGTDLSTRALRDSGATELAGRDPGSTVAKTNITLWLPTTNRGDNMPGKRPTWRFLLHEVGAAWATSKADVFGVTLDLEGNGDKIKIPHGQGRLAEPTVTIRTRRTICCLDRLPTCAAYWSVEPNHAGQWSRS
jgi:hypothetical protein